MALPIAWAAVGAGSIAMSLLRRARRRAGEPSDAANPALSADTDDKPSPDSPSPSAVAETDGDRHDAPSSDGASETAGGEGSTLRRRRGKGEGGSEAGGRAGEGAGRAAEADSTRDERGPAERSAANGVANGATDDDAASAEESRAAQVEAAGADACGEGTNAGECGDGQATEDAAEGAEDETSVGEVVGERPDHAAEGGVAAGAAGAAEETSGAAANTGVGAGESKAQGKPEVATADEATPKAAQPAKAPQTKPRQQPLGVFVFWLVFITLTGLIAGIFLLAQFLFLQDAGHSDFISIPPLVRAHLDRGQTLKVAAPGAMVGGKSGHGQQEQVEVFVRAEGWGTGRGRRWGAEGRAGESGGGRAGDGQSKEVVVLLHGLGGSSFLYRDVITLLADKGLRAVAFDLPGSGLSTKLTSVEEGAAAVYPVHQLARTIDRVLSALGITEPVHLVLHDTGGVVGTLWAADNVPRVRSITLVDTPMEDPFAPAFPPAWLLRYPHLATLAARAVFPVAALLASCCINTVPDDVARAHAYLLQAHGGIHAAILARQHGNLTHDVARTVQRHAERALGRVPRQLLWSEEAEEQGEEVRSHWPLADFHLHKGKRWPQEDHPRDIAEAIARFVLAQPPLPAAAGAGRDGGKKHVSEHSAATAGGKVKGGGGCQHGHSHGHDHEHGHGHGLGYMDDISQGPGTRHGGWVM